MITGDAVTEIATRLNLLYPNNVLRYGNNLDDAVQHKPPFVFVQGSVQPLKENYEEINGIMQTWVEVQISFFNFITSNIEANVRTIATEIYNQIEGGIYTNIDLIKWVEFGIYGEIYEDLCGGYFIINLLVHFFRNSIT